MTISTNVLQSPSSQSFSGSSSANQEQLSNYQQDAIPENNDRSLITGTVSAPAAPISPKTEILRRLAERASPLSNENTPVASFNADKIRRQLLGRSSSTSTESPASNNSSENSSPVRAYKIANTEENEDSLTLNESPAHADSREKISPHYLYAVQNRELQDSPALRETPEEKDGNSPLILNGPRTSIDFEVLDLAAEDSDEASENEMNHVKPDTQLRLNNRTLTDRECEFGLLLYPNLEAITFSRTELLTDAIAKSLGNLTKLKSVTFFNCPGITKKVIEDLVQHPTIESITIRYCDQIKPREMIDIKLIYPDISIQYTPRQCQFSVGHIVVYSTDQPLDTETERLRAAYSSSMLTNFPQGQISSVEEL